MWRKSKWHFLHLCYTDSEWRPPKCPVAINCIPLLQIVYNHTFYLCHYFTEANQASAHTPFLPFVVKENERRVMEMEKHSSYLSCHTLGHIFDSVLSEWLRSLPLIYRTWHLLGGKTEVSRCHHMFQGIVVAKVMWWLSGKRYPARASFLVCGRDNSVALISIKVTLKTISWYDTPGADRRRDRRKRLLTCRWSQTWRGIHYHISPSEDVTCHFTLLRVLIILHHI